MKKILLVEDDEGLAIGIEFTLKDEGFEVLTCRSVEETMNAYRKNKFDFVILDVMLPDGTGYDICKEIRKESDIPIIFLTACDDEVNVVLGLDIGADDYITKPFKVKELISRIKAILRRIENKFSANKNILKCRDIMLNMKTATVYKNNESICVSSQEYKLILIFMSNPSRVMSREEILDNLIDGQGVYFDSNTLSVYIKRVREKIEDDFSNPRYIVTKRGCGYKWNLEVQKE